MIDSYDELRRKVEDLQKNKTSSFPKILLSYNLNENPRQRQDAKIHLRMHRANGQEF